MDKTQIIIFSAAMAFLIIRLYQKYIKKNRKKPDTETRQKYDGSFPSSKDDEYEPYSKK